VHLDVESVPAWIRLAHELDNARGRSLLCPAYSHPTPRHCRIFARKAFRRNLVTSRGTIAVSPSRDRPRLWPLSRSLNARGEGRRCRCGP